MAITVYTYNDKVLKNVTTDKWLKKSVDPYNPLDLPANTIRIKFISDYYPTMGDSRTLVDSTNNVWDIYKESNNWESLFQGYPTQLLEVLGANTTNVTSMQRLFISCGTITKVSLFNTSNVTNMSYMFGYCSSLTTVPLFNTSNATDMSSMFRDCINVESGALTLYQQASTQATPPSSHGNTFTNCGRDTTTGAAELAQIPSSWGGKAS